MVCSLLLWSLLELERNKESQQSILLRIIANYFQLLTAAMSFNLKFPKSLTQALFPAQKIGTSSDAFLSFDWFISDSSVLVIDPNIAIFKVILTGLLPIALILIGIWVISLVYFIPAKVWKEFKRNLWITIIVILYLLHPMLTKVGIEMFQWIQVEDNKYSAKINLDFGWYSSDHMKWCVFIGVQ